jgi:LysR family transcriptional regulator, hydrogen peroxide-inducible genes activator
MVPSSVTLRQLRYFDALARHSHFGRAAAACAISQPALSMQIKELEEILGAPLIERGGRKVGLTKFGEEASSRVRDILRSVDELGAFARVSRDRIAGRLRVGMIPTIAPYLLPRLIEDLARTHPEVEIHLREAVTSKLTEELAEGRLDTAIVALPVSEPSLTEVALFSENFLLVRPGEDEGKPLSTLVQMVRAGMGVTLIPEMAVAVETGSGSVSVARFKDPQPSRTVGMIWRKTSPLASQLLQLSHLIGPATNALREHHKPELSGMGATRGPGSSSPDPGAAQNAPR